MIFGSVCSGIDAASVAWTNEYGGSLGWECAFQSEIDKFSCEALKQRYPNVPNYGDMTNYKEWPDHGRESTRPIDVLIGGTPCQSFSVAGLRGGLNDDRGNLMLTFVNILTQYRPRWFIWENVPGVLSSNEGEDFGSLLGALAEIGYGFAYRILDTQHVRTSRFPFAIPQRRRRVFVVGYLGNWRRAAAVLFDAKSLQGNNPPRRKTRRKIIGKAPFGFTQSGFAQYKENEYAGTLTALGGDNGGGSEPLISTTVSDTLTVGANQTVGRPGWFCATKKPEFVSHTLKAEGFDGSEDGTGRGVPLIAENMFAGAGDVAPTMVCEGNAHSGFRDEKGLVAVAIQTAHTSQNGSGFKDDVSYTLDTSSGGQVVFDPTEWVIRKLTCVECERLQGFPDHFTMIDYTRRAKLKKLMEDVERYATRHGFDTTDERVIRAFMSPDGPRYKALGNSMSVNVIEYLGQRIDMVDRMTGIIGKD